MLLRPLKPGGPVPPLVMEGGGTRASVTFLDGVPVHTAAGSARFTVRTGTRKFRRQKPDRTVDAGVPVALPLGRGDVLTLSVGSVEHAWTYDPDGNLPRFGRVAMWFAREGVYPLVVAGAVALALQVNLADTQSFAGPGKPGDPLPELVRRNAYQVYPPNETSPSEYLREMVAAKREGRDLAQASRDWIAAHGQAAKKPEGDAR